MLHVRAMTFVLFKERALVQVERASFDLFLTLLTLLAGGFFSRSLFRRCTASSQLLLADIFQNWNLLRVPLSTHRLVTFACRTCLRPNFQLFAR